MIFPRERRCPYVSDPDTMPIEELSLLAVRAAYLVPERRRQELADYRASLRRPQIPRDEAEARKKDLVNRREQEILASRKLSTTERAPVSKRGPRGGQYTEAITKDGRPYRRYF